MVPCTHQQTDNRLCSDHVTFPSQAENSNLVRKEKQSISTYKIVIFLFLVYSWGIRLPSLLVASAVG